MEIENISPAPWGVEMGMRDGMNIVRCLKDAKGETIVETDSGYYPPKIEDAYLMAAAPILYSCLNDATTLWCRQCAKISCDEDCPANAWKKALLAAKKGFANA